MSEYVSLGFVPLNKDGTPVRAISYRYGKEVRHPPRIYQTAKMAEAQGGRAAEVFFKGVDKPE
jgi:hypothetical protein